MKPKLLVADDHKLVLEGLTRLLEERYELLGTVEDGRAAVKAADELKPDIILMDVSMPILNGIEAARQIRAKTPTAKIIFVTMQANPDYVREAFRAGASGYVLKNSAASELSMAIDEVANNRYYVTPLVPNVTAGAVSEAPPSFSRTLTTRQREVLQLVAEGHTGKEIATMLDISLKTVEFHKANLMESLGLRTTAELTRYALESGLVT
jgi:DNA-binding NarL/FixJ family response regulator